MKLKKYYETFCRMIFLGENRYSWEQTCYAADGGPAPDHGHCHRHGPRGE